MENEQMKRIKQKKLVVAAVGEEFAIRAARDVRSMSAGWREQQSIECFVVVVAAV